MRARTESGTDTDSDRATDRCGAGGVRIRAGYGAVAGDASTHHLPSRCRCVSHTPAQCFAVTPHGSRAHHRAPIDGLITTELRSHRCRPSMGQVQPESVRCSVVTSRGASAEAVSMPELGAIHGAGSMNARRTRAQISVARELRSISLPYLLLSPEDRAGPTPEKRA